MIWAIVKCQCTNSGPVTYSSDSGHGLGRPEWISEFWFCHPWLVALGQFFNLLAPPWTHFRYQINSMYLTMLLWSFKAMTPRKGSAVCLEQGSPTKMPVTCVFIQQIALKHPLCPGTVLVARDKAMNKSHKNSSPDGMYILAENNI